MIKPRFWRLPIEDGREILQKVRAWGDTSGMTYNEVAEKVGLTKQEKEVLLIVLTSEPPFGIKGLKND